MGRRYQSSTIAGSPLYMAPEQLAGSYLTTKVGPRRARGRGAEGGRCGEGAGRRVRGGGGAGEGRGLVGGGWFGRSARTDELGAAAIYRFCSSAEPRREPESFT